MSGDLLAVAAQGPDSAVNTHVLTLRPAPRLNRLATAEE